MITGRDVGVAAGAFGADEQDEAKIVAVRKARLAGFDDNFEGRFVFNKVALGFVKIFIEVHFLVEIGRDQSRCET